MTQTSLEGIVSSKTRLLIADLVSTRPRTLLELAKVTGMSAPGVLKQIRKLAEVGLVEEAEFEGGSVAARKIYRLKGRPVKDFSGDDFVVVKEARAEAGQARSDDPMRELEALSADVILEKRRVREQVRKLGRTIDRVAESEAGLNALVDGLRLSDLDKLLVRTAFTEESVDDAEGYLREMCGLPDARTALDRALEKVRRVGKA